MAMTDDEKASFGFRDVPKSEKARLVRGVFESVASRYDLMNDLMSGGLHRYWKIVLADRVDPKPGETFLDVAGGTGDVARALLARARRRAGRHGGEAARAIIADINLEMLRAGAARDVGDDGLARVCADAERLPLGDRTIDAYTIAFGIRNVTEITAALAEARRVLRSGGRFVCLEFSHLSIEGLKRAYDAYSFNIIPRLGALVTGDRESYQYLVESIRRFPPQEKFAEMIRAAGFARVAHENLTGGVVAIHRGWRL